MFVYKKITYAQRILNHQLPPACQLFTDLLVKNCKYSVYRNCYYIGSQRYIHPSSGDRGLYTHGWATKVHTSIIGWLRCVHPTSADQDLYVHRVIKVYISNIGWPKSIHPSSGHQGLYIHHRVTIHHQWQRSVRPSLGDQDLFIHRRVTAVLLICISCDHGRLTILPITFLLYSIIPFPSSQIWL